MNELITIEKQTIGYEQVNTVNARDLWEFLEVKREFATWIKEKIDKYDFAVNEDYCLDKNVKPTHIGIGGVQKIDYHISLDMGKELSMVQNNRKGKEIRKYFIECEKQLKNQMIPLTGKQYAERMLAYEIEKEEMQAKTLQLETQITSEKPLVDFARKFAASKEDILVGDLAKMLCTPEIPTGRDRLFEWMRILKIVNPFENVPYQPFIEKGFFKPYKGTSKDGKRSFTTYRVTTKGQIYLHRKWVKYHKKLKKVTK